MTLLVYAVALLLLTVQVVCYSNRESSRSRGVKRTSSRWRSSERLQYSYPTAMYLKDYTLGVNETPMWISSAISWGGKQIFRYMQSGPGSALSFLVGSALFLLGSMQYTSPCTPRGALIGGWSYTIGSILFFILEFIHFDKFLRIAARQPLRLISKRSHFFFLLPPLYFYWTLLL